MATRRKHPEPCSVCRGEQILVKLDDHGNQVQGNWRVKLPERSIGEAFAGRYVSDVSVYACTSCKQLAFYVHSIKELLE
jgi:hypothetical protein